ncbi:MAG: glycoside hydrolase family 140 protein [Candidatus Sumerlaeia bacterium]|nr:glycoside hydrolase family 140 protein [Candidatus Sumerlaeia bacterium]
MAQWQPLTDSTHAADRTSPFPVRISANGRHLVDASGKPFLLHGDTAWSLIVQLTKEETEEYLENRRQKGFNAILVNLIEYFYADNPPKNKYGDGPFKTSGDFSKPNESYFAHADRVIRRAGEKGILVIVNPCYTGFGASKTDGWVEEIVANGPAKCRNYGRYVGNRYKDYTNIIWQAGGDQMIKPGSPLEQNWLEILQGIREYAPNHFWTAHWNRFSIACDQPAFEPYMDIVNAYGGNRTYIQTLRAYNRPNPKPTFFNEAYYEDTQLVTGAGAPHLLRAQAYWAILSGAAGHLFGSDHIWAFGARTYGKPNAPRYDWRAGMESRGACEMMHVKSLFERRAWYDLVPDQDHTVVTSGYGTFGKDDRSVGGDYVAAACTRDGSLIMAYVPSTGTGTRTITVNMSRLSGPAFARWYNPTTGAYSDIAGSPLPNSRSRNFTTPGDNGTGANDWVLVLETTPAASPATRSQPAK